MAKKFYRRRRNYKSRKGRSRFKKLERRVAKITRSIEKKYWDNSFTYTLDWDGDFHTCNAPSSGLGDDERVGDKIVITSLAFRFSLQRNNAGDFPAVRILVIWDKLNLVTALSDMLITGAGAFAYLSQMSIDRRADFLVLKDKTYQLDSAGPNDITRSMVVKLNKTTQFASSTTTITKGVLRLVMIASTDPTATNRPILEGYTRIRYTDL